MLDRGVGVLTETTQEYTMARFATWTTLIGALCASIAMTASADVYKCTVAGAVTFQNTPCHGGKAHQQERMELPAPTSGQGLRGTAISPTDTPKLSGFKCDGRRHCTQMTSCQEASYFLSHCPNVEMDGDHDGIPCEQQWCGRR